MEDREQRWCKACGEPFGLTSYEVCYYNRRLFAIPQMKLPEHCPNCRPKKKAQDRRLACTNFPVPNSWHGDGCFLEGLTKADIDRIGAWSRDTHLPEPSPMPERIREEEEKRQVHQLVLWAPSWINDPVPSMGGTPQYLWRSVATLRQIEYPTVLKFCVEDRLTGVAWLRDLPQGLTLWWLEYARWVDSYQKAELSLPFYAISESIRQGHRGRIFVRPIAKHRSLFQSMGCRPILSGKLLELSAEDAWRLVMCEYGVPGTVVDLLVQWDSTGDADVAWIVQQVIRGIVRPQFIEGLTRLTPDCSWLDAKRLAVERGNIPSEERILLRHRVRDVIGALAIRELFEELGTEVQYTEGIPALGQIVRFPKEQRIRGFRGIDRATERVMEYALWLEAGEEVIVISRIWSQNDYDVDESGRISEIWAEAPDLPACRILAVSSDFDEIGEEQQKSLIHSVAEQGAHLLVVRRYQARLMQKEVRDLFRLLASTTPQLNRLGENRDRVIGSKGKTYQ